MKEKAEYQQIVDYFKSYDHTACGALCKGNNPCEGEHAAAVDIGLCGADHDATVGIYYNSNWRKDGTQGGYTLGSYDGPRIFANTFRRLFNENVVGGNHLPEAEQAQAQKEGATRRYHPALFGRDDGRPTGRRYQTD